MTNKTGKENRILFRSKKQTVPDMSEYGFLIPSVEQISRTDRIFVCFLKGILIYAVTMGCIGGLISSFDLNCHRFVIITGLFILSMITALLRVRRLIFDLGYPVLFAIFAIGISSSFRLVNSGYQNFLSIMQKAYSDYYNLSSYRELEEITYDPAVSMTYAAIFIGFFLILLLNMVISEHMSLWMTILLTFPVFQLGIYIGKYPSFIYLVLLLFGYFFIGVWKFSGHYQIPMTKKDQTVYKVVNQDKMIGYHYRIQGRAVFELSGVVFLLALIVAIMLFATQNNQNLERKTESSLRASIDRKLEILTQNGLMGLFDRYQTTGGLSEGKLGGVSSIRPDYETDLCVTLVPYSLEPIYLKAYTGTIYTGKSWDAVYPEVKLGDSHYEKNNELTAGQRMDSVSDQELLQVKCKVKNLDANTNHLYLPYYPSDLSTVSFSMNHGLIDGYSILNREYEFWYYPESVYQELMENSENDWNTLYNEQNDTHFDQIYLQVPKQIEKDLLAIMEEIGYADTTTGQIQLIQNYFADFFTYTMSPGATPVSKDVAIHFLKNQKRGYCAHFATAAALLLREYGIPARYVEGYCFSPTEVVGALQEEEKKEDWISQDGAFEDAGVVTMEVTDAAAHAWVEVYYEEFGWVPYEFTVGQAEETSGEAGSDFFSIFGNLFSGNNSSRSGSYDTDSILSNQDMSLREISKSVVKNVGIVALFVLFIILLMWLIKGAVRYVSMRILFAKGSYDKYLLYRFERVCRKQTVKREANGSLSEDENLCEPLKRAYAEMERCFFSEQGITKMEAREILKLLKNTK